MSSARGTNRWAAHWIWDEETPGDRERQVIAARCSVQLDEVPISAPGRIFADSMYVLYVNGVEIRRGPGRANPRSRRYDVVDLAAGLRLGDNTITIIAAINRRASRNWMPAPTVVGELGGGALAFEADLGLGEPVCTGPGWLTTTIEGWTLSRPTGTVSFRGLERIDARELPNDLHTVESAATRWRPARVKSGRGMGDRESVHPPSYPYGPTRATVLAPPVVRPRRLHRGAEGMWSLDDVGSGTLCLDIEGPAGAVVTATIAEVIESDGRPRPFHEPIGVELTLGNGRALVETLDQFGLVALCIDAPAEVTVHSIVLNERTYPLVGNGRFECDDPYYEQLYRAGRRTVSLCSLDAYVDNPTREGRAWTGDSVVHQMVDLASNADWSLARWNPRIQALSALPDGMIPAAVAGDGEHSQVGIVVDWALHWVHSLWNLSRYVGDVEEIAELLPTAERVVGWFDQFDNPAVGMPTDVIGWTLVDWSWVVTRGTSSVLIGLLGRALLEVAEMAEFCGDAGRARRARRRHGELAVAYEQFWDPERQRYADNLLSGVRERTASQHGQAAAIVGGFAPPQRHGRLVELLTDRRHHVHATLSVPEGDPGMDGRYVLPGAELGIRELPEPWWDVEEQLVMAQPFFRYVVHDALAQAGRADLITETLLDWKPLLDRCPTSFAETYWSGSLAQGWSSCPTRDLITYVAGITPAEPGYAVVGVEPALGALSWVHAVAPTPHGDVEVRVDASFIEVHSPRPVRIQGRLLGPGHHRVAVSS